MKTTFNWKIFWILLAAATIGLIAIIPYTFALQASTPLPANLPMPLPVIVAIQIGVQVVVFGILIALGLFFAGRIGLGLPILEARLRGRTCRLARLRAILPISVILGVLGALLIIALDVYVFQPALKAQLGQAASGLTGRAATPAAWKGFLASFYGGLG